LKPVFHLIGARVETTWVPGAFQLWVRRRQRAPGPPPLPRGGDVDRAVAAHADFGVARAPALFPRLDVAAVQVE
jgi:hypothetical protein